MAQISCVALNKKYGSVEVVPDFNLEVADHEFVVFLGPSGCGKSTIMRMIAGLEQISGGTLKIGDRVVNEMEPGERGIAMVFQNYALYPHMSIFENIAFGLRRLKTPEPEIKRRVGDVVSMLGLQPYLDRKPTQLSGGQQQRVAIARAMIKTPEVFLFDEPLSNLDAKLRHQMRQEIASLHKKLRSTTIYVTHDQMEAMTLADRIVLMNAGKIEQVGSPEDIYANPETLFVAGFIGTPAMNFLDVTSRQAADDWLLVGDGVELRIGPVAFDLSEGQRITLGIRPSDLTPIVGPGSTGAFRGVCDMVEFHGDQVLLGFAIGDQRVTSLIPARQRIAEGEKAAFKVDEAHIHLFDTGSGKSLRRKPR